METELAVKRREAAAELTITGTGKNLKLVATWLLTICLLLFAIILVGGATRLTESGLSITEWDPILGVVPPLSEQSWQVEFEKYKQIPEYQLINKGMSLQEFKYIYYWEWGHRLLGRLIGVVFLVPFAFFLMAGRLERRWIPHLTAVFALGGLQGLIGWWMVSSGLVDRVDVSQYRLAVHLVLACLILAYVIFILRGIYASRPAIVGPARLMKVSGAILALIFIQIFSGALVAGLNAGLTYNTWPLMDGEFIPSGLFDNSPFWINFFENILTVQFQHRMIAYAIFLLTLFHAIQCYKSMDFRLFRMSLLLFLLTFLQAAWGIATLLMVSPVNMALLHQALAVILLVCSVWHFTSFLNFSRNASQQAISTN